MLIQLIPTCLILSGRPDEAMKQIEIAVELDPLNAKIKSFYGS